MGIFEKNKYFDPAVPVRVLPVILFLFVLPAQAGAEEPKECLECHPDYYDELDGEFNHDPFQKKDCYACHQFHGFRNDTELNGSIVDICSGCHFIIDEVGSDYLHDPVADDASCLNCHAPHSSGTKSLLSMPAKRLCTECHESGTEARGFIHAPYRDSSCVECHNPHGSPFGTYFQMPIGYLCLGCHSDRFDSLDPSQIHSADETRSCENCHTGHFSAFEGLLLNETDSLCLGCHTELAAKINSGKRHSVLENFDCLACHKPHFIKSSSYTLDEGKVLCLSCHGEIEERLGLEVTHAAAEEDCISCHNPHVQTHLSDQPALCGECHDMEDGDFMKSHLGISPGFCTECHEPHGTIAKKLLRGGGHAPYSEGECGICHDPDQGDKWLSKNDLCLDCHDIDSEAHVDQNIVNKHCIDCHSPHASSREGLLRAPR